MTLGWRRLHASISLSDKLDLVSDQAALLFTWMQPHADDQGRLQGEPCYIRKLVVPGRKDGWEPEDVARYLNELRQRELVDVYEGTDPPGKFFIEIRKFRELQPPGDGKRRHASQYPDNTGKMPSNVNGCNWMSSDAQNRTEQKRKEKKRKERSLSSKLEE